MTVILGDTNSYILRFDRGEELVNSLLHFAQTEGVDAGHFTAIGAAGELVVSYYNLAEKQYLDKVVTEDLEIVSLTGNIAWMEEQPVIHAHGVFSRSDFSTFGGHVKKLIVSATCEVHLQKLDGGLARSFDSVTGLNLLK